MKLIIDIPMDAYSMIKETTFTEDTDRMFLQTPEDRLKTMLLFKTLDSIKNGTPLPKGHGRLGDLDALEEEVSSWGMNDYEPLDFIDEIDRADTIIEADKEEEG